MGWFYDDEWGGRAAADQVLSLLRRDHPAALPSTWHRRIGCAGCGSVATFTAAGGIDLVHGRMRLWHDGWRRDPDTALDYCPPCALARNPGGG